MLKEASILLGFNESSNVNLTDNGSCNPNHIDCHRWRHAATTNTQVSATIFSDKPFAYLDQSKQWIVTGDWCGEGRIENCFDAAKAVLTLINQM